MDAAITDSILKNPNPHVLGRSNSSQQVLVTQASITNHKLPKFGSSRTMLNLISRENKSENENSIKEEVNSEEQQRHNLICDINNQLNTMINGTSIDSKKGRIVDPVLVTVCVVFLKIGEIDTVKEQYHADAYIECSWVDTNVDFKVPYDSRTNWTPEIQIENAIGELKQEIRYKVERLSNNKAKIIEMRNIKGVFWERLELWDFPLDIQELSITLSSSHKENQIQFESDPHHPCAVNTEDFLNQQEWNLFSYVNTSKKSINDLWNNYKRPCYTATALVSRKPGYFIYNAYLLIFFVSTLGFVPFSFTLSNHHFRIQVTSLLILTSVNFRWIVTQRLPTVSYLTILDKYAIAALIFLVLLCCWHATIGSTLLDGNSDPNYKENIDRIVFIVLTVLYFLYNVVYFSLFYYKYRKYNEIVRKFEASRQNKENTTIGKLVTENINKSKTNIQYVDRKLSVGKRHSIDVNGEGRHNNLSILKNLNTSSTHLGGSGTDLATDLSAKV